MTALRGVTTQWTSGDTSADVVIPTCQAGDFLFVFVGGGNRVTNVPDGWVFAYFLTGQEAQGIVYERVAEGVETGDLVTVNFDGPDPRYIAAVAVQDCDELVENKVARAGTAGGTMAASTAEWTAAQYQGDLLLTFAFCRNADLPPTMDRGVLWEAQTHDGSSAALYIESLPAYSESEPFALNLPERSGHVYFSIPIWGLTVSDWIQGPDFEVEQELWQEVLQDTKLDADHVDDPDQYPTITQATFLGSQEQQQFGFDAFPPDAARWSHDRFVHATFDFWRRSWETSRTVSLFAAHLPTASLSEPFNDTFPEDAVGVAEWQAGSATLGSQAIAASSKVVIRDVASDSTDGTPQNLISSAFSTVLFSTVGQVTWDSSGGIASWSRLIGPDAHVLHVRGGQMSPGTTSTTIDVTEALDPSGQARLAALSIVLGPGGFGEPQMNLRSYTFEGGADFGAIYDFQNVAGAALTWTVRPGLRRHTLRRGPIVDIRPVVAFVSVVRQFPRDDEFGQGAGPRIFPPPRRGRVVGGYQ